MSSPKERFKSLMDYAMGLGLNFSIMQGELDIDKEICNAGVVELQPNHFLIATNERLANSSEDVLYAALAHEVGHALANLTKNEALQMAKLRELGHPAAISNEVAADKFACLVSLTGIRKLLNSFEGYGNPYELEIRMDSINEFEE